MEFAFVLPILIALVSGIINWGMVFAAQISLNSAARDAARSGVVHSIGGTGMSCANIATLARNSAATLGVAPINIGVTVTSPDGTTSCTWAKGTAVGTDARQMCLLTSGQLVVVLKYTAVAPMPLVPPSSIDLTGTGAFQCEYS